MNGMTLAKAVEEELKRQGISKGDFYKAVGISATAMYGWKRGAESKKETINFSSQKVAEINKWGEKQSLFTPRILVTRTGLEPKTKVPKSA